VLYDRFDRRRFLEALGLGVVAAVYKSCSRDARSSEGMLSPPIDRRGVFPAVRNPDYDLPSAVARRALTPRDKAAAHGNFSEFLPGRGGAVWKYTHSFEVAPWRLEVTGECERPRVLHLDDLLAIAHEERVYPFRCVEGWAMNVPWTGFPLRKLLETARPLSSARYVVFTSALRPQEMPGVRISRYLRWPYVESLRLDEAMCELTLVATGVYGQPLLKQHGAPVRLVVPWKYGYKSPKSIVKIELVEKPPMTFWMMQPHEYGFLSNINPNVPHPRWSQAQSYWLDTQEPFPTAIFNGYDAQVAALYPDEPRTPQQPLREGQTAR
ncbi:MAG: protein-methionine-sulfoxide reductase catalytic subunit MsrP, partial [Vicinamibacteria bacterium]